VRLFVGSWCLYEAVPEALRSKSIIFEDKDLIYEDNKILGMMYSGDESDNLHFAAKFEPNDTNEFSRDGRTEPSSKLQASFPRSARDISTSLDISSP